MSLKPKIQAPKIQAPKIQAIVFDAYGTLFDVYSIGALADQLFPGSGSQLAQIWRERQIDYTRLRTMCDQYVDFWKITEDALEFACEALKLNLGSDARAQLMGQYAKLDAFPENLAVLKQLKADGYPLGILSNGTHTMINSAIMSAGMTGYFDPILTVEGVKKFKTTPEVYQLAPDAFELAASQILFVSSNCWDACGATWFGFQTIWINRANAPLEKLGIEPSAIGHSLEDVAGYINQKP